MYIRKSAGFTILELLIVVMIGMIVTAISVPTILDVMPVYKVNSGARTMISHLQWARMQAAANNSNYTITFNTVNNTYTITGTSVSRAETLAEDVQFGFSGTPAGVIAGGAISGAVESPEGTSINSIVYLPTGALANSAAIYLIPTQDTGPSGRQDRMRAIRITGSTGAAAIYAYKNNSWTR